MLDGNGVFPLDGQCHVTGFYFDQLPGGLLPGGLLPGGLLPSEGRAKVCLCFVNVLDSKPSTL